MKCIFCEKALKGKQRKYCSNYCQVREWNKRNPKYLKEYNVTEKVREWRIKNKELHKLQVKRNGKIDREKNRDLYIIRGKTLRIYGKAEVCSKCCSTDNIAHHHTTKPYEVDKFVDLCRKCHMEYHIQKN